MSARATVVATTGVARAHTASFWKELIGGGFESPRFAGDPHFLPRIDAIKSPVAISRSPAELAISDSFNKTSRLFEWLQFWNTVVSNDACDISLRMRDWYLRDKLRCSGESLLWLLRMFPDLCFNNPKIMTAIMPQMLPEVIRPSSGKEIWERTSLLHWTGPPPSKMDGILSQLLRHA
jgi:hypothetical protein